MIGAGIAALSHGVLEGYYNLNSQTMTNVFPYIGIPYIEKWVPPLDVWLVAGVPAAAYMLTKKDSPTKKAALGATIVGGGIWLAEFIARVMMGGRSQGWYSASSAYRNGYAGPTNPQPSPFAAPADPQAQLMIGSKAGINRDVYKPNVSAPECAGMNAANQQLFV
jgi:hypothetical protein